MLTTGDKIFLTVALGLMAITGFANGVVYMQEQMRREAVEHKVGGYFCDQ